MSSPEWKEKGQHRRYRGWREWVRGMCDSRAVVFSFSFPWLFFWVKWEWSKRSKRKGGMHGGWEFRTGASMGMEGCLACLLVKAGDEASQVFASFVWGGAGQLRGYDNTRGVGWLGAPLWEWTLGGGKWLC